MSVKAALLCGLNYIGSNSELNGCINDVTNMRDVLIKHYGYDAKNITVLTDNTKVKPTKANIIKYLQKLISNTTATHLYFHYSGHGSTVLDKNNDEIDGCDECIIPLDFRKNNTVITDDEINQIVKQLRPECKLSMVFDACHSGTMVDLKYDLQCLSVHNNSAQVDPNDVYMYQNWSYDYKVSQNSKYNDLAANVFSLSGCLDSQTSADAYINKKFQGALTYVLMKVLEINQYKNIKLKYLLKDIHCMLKQQQYSQKPVIQSSKPIQLDGEFSI